MPAAKYKQKCQRCKKNYTLASYRTRRVLCESCKEELLNKIPEDEKYKKLLDIPKKFYKENRFLTDIKLNYFQFDNLTENQIKAFKETVKNMKKEEKNKTK